MAARRRLDWSWGPGHGPVSGVGNAALSACSVTMVSDLLNAADVWPTAPWWTLGLGAGAAALAAGMGAWQYAPTRVVCYRALCWLAAGAWSAWSIAGNPWSLRSLATLITGSVTAAAVGVIFSRAEAREQAREQRAAQALQPKLRPVAKPANEEERIAAEWLPRLRRVTRVNLAILGVEKWQPYTGFTIDVDLPDDGTTIDQVKGYEKALATAANLPPGCNVEVLPNDIGRRSILIRVATVNAMAEDQHLPEDYSPATIENDLSLGVHADRTEASINLRFACAVLIGQTDSGKSNQLNVITTGLVRCVDTLVWAIDLSGNGRFPRPWVRAFKEGRADEPALDWVAATADEALLMTQAAIQIINGRTPAYQQLMFDSNVDYVPVSPTLPQIVIVVDEFGTLPEAVKENIKTISDTGRGAGVRVVSCALAAKSQYIPRDVIVQARERIGMRVTDEAELQYLFDAVWSRGRFDPASLPYRGSGLVSTGATAPVPFKGWRMDPARIDAASIAVAGLRPALDDVSCELAESVTVTVPGPVGREQQRVDGVYSGRWERMLPVMFPDRASGPATPPAPAAPQEPHGPRQIATPEQATATLQAALADLNEATERAQAAAAAAEDPEVRALNELWAMPEVDPQRPWSQPPRPRPRIHPRERMREMVHEARENGIGPTEVTKRLKDEAYPTTYQTVNDWMREDARNGVISQPGGDRTPYFPPPAGV